MTAQELRIGGGRVLDAIGTALSLGSYFDVFMEIAPLIREWQATDASWGTSTGLRTRLSILVRAGKIITARTPTPEDDAWLARLEVLLSADAVIDILASIIARFATENPAATPQGLLAFVERPDIHESLAEVAAEKAIDLGTIIEAVKLIIQLITLFKGATGSSAPAAPAPSSPSNPWGF